MMQSHQAMALQSQIYRAGSDSVPASNTQSPPKKLGSPAQSRDCCNGCGSLCFSCSPRLFFQRHQLLVWTFADTVRPLSSSTLHRGGGFMRSLATSITGSGGSNKDEMQRAYSRGETLHQGVVSSIALASVASSTSEKKGKLQPGQTFEMSPSMRAAWQADHSDRNRCTP